MIDHELATGQIVVAEQAGHLIGFATLIVRGGVAFLADCFVRAETQSGGVGRLLVGQLLPGTSPTFCTLSLQKTIARWRCIFARGCARSGPTSVCSRTATGSAISLAMWR